MKKSIPLSQKQQIKRICTRPNDLSQYFEKVQQKFVNQGDRPEQITLHIIKAVEKRRVNNL